MNIPAPTSSAGNPPQIEDGLCVVRFNDIYHEVHEDWATERDKFGHKDDGSRFHFNATVLDEKRQPVLLVDVKEDVDDPTQEFQLEALTRNMSSHEKANSYALLKGLLTPAEFVMWAEQTPEEPADLSGVAGREVNAMIGHSKSGWPQIEAFLGKAKAVK